MATTAIINGVAYSWGNLSIVLFGNVVIGATKLSYKAKQDKKNGMAWGNKPVYREYGNYEYEGSIEMYYDEWKKIVSVSPNGDPLQILPSDIQVVFSGSRVLPTGASLKAVEFMENPFDGNQGDSSFKVTIPLLIGDIAA